MHLLTGACTPASLSAHSFPHIANLEVAGTALESSRYAVCCDAPRCIRQLFFCGFLLAFKCRTRFKDVFELGGAHFGAVWGLVQAFNNARINCTY